MRQIIPNRLVAARLGDSARADLSLLEPWAELTSEMNRLVDGIVRSAATGPSDVAWIPAVDAEEREDGLRLSVEVPGIRPDDIEITVDDGILTIAGERKLERKDGEQGKSSYRLERRYGRFARSIALPKWVDADRITARSQNGVLQLELPKAAEAKPRRIAIAAGAEIAS